MTAEPIPKASPRWQGLQATGKLLDTGDAEPGKPLIVNCHGHTDVGICGECAEDFAHVLADVPELLDDLDIAIAGEAKFVEHGTILGTTESSGPSRHPAIAAQQRLHVAILGDGTQAHPGVSDWFDGSDPSRLAHHLGRLLPRLVHEVRLPQLARDITGAAARAHHVIDAPPDLVYYGPCPDCGNPIKQERIHRDDDETEVVCRSPSCKYTAPKDVHYKRILKENEDRWMTVSELVSAITSGGEVVNRNQIYYWERKAGLAREMRTRARWVNGDLVTDEVWCFRLGDVRQRAAEAAKKNPRLVADAQSTT